MEDRELSKDFQDGIQKGKLLEGRRILESILKIETTEVGLSVLIWMMVCEVMNEKVPIEDRKNVILNKVYKEIDHWLY